MSFLQLLFEFDGPAIMAVGALVGSAGALLGTFLVLRGASMLVDAISHSVLLGILLVWLATRQQSGPLLILGAAAIGLVTVLLSDLLERSGKVKSDAAIGLVFPALFAAGALLANLFARDVHIDADTVLLGEIGFVGFNTVVIFGREVPVALASMGVLALVDLAFVTLFYKELKLTTFDRALARALGFRPALLGYGLLALTSATAVAAFDAVGAILLVAFVIVPPSAAYLLTDRLWRMLVYGVLIACASSVIGYAAAIALDVSIGGMMALTTGGFLALSFLLSPRYGLLAQEQRRRSQHRRNDNRALVVHLYNHERSSDRRGENAVAALHTHLDWSAARAQRVLLRCLDENLVRRRGDALELTPKGRVVAQEVIEPWRQSGAAVAAGD